MYFLSTLWHLDAIVGSPLHTTCNGINVYSIRAIFHNMDRSPIRHNFLSFIGNEIENGEEQFSGGAEDSDISHGKLVSNIN